MINVIDFGAIGDGVTDDTAAIQAAVDASSSGSVILFPAGDYKISSSVAVSNKKQFLFLGNGATIKGTSTRFQSYFHMSGCQGITFRGFTFDQMKYVLPVYDPYHYDEIYNCPVYFEGDSQDLQIQDCIFINLYTVGVFCYSSNNISIDACSFRSPVQTQTQMLQHIHVQTCSGLLTVRDCEFINAAPSSPAAVPCGVFVSGHTGSSFVENNRFEYCGRNNTGSHRLGVIDFYTDANNVRILNNVSINGMAQFARLSAIRNGIVQGNRVHTNELAELDYSTLTIEGVANLRGQQGVQDMQVIDNVFEDPGQRAAFTVGVLSYNWNYPSTNIKVARNSFTGSRRAVYVAGPFRNVTVESNEMRGHIGSIEVGHNGTNASAMVGGVEASSAFENLSIRNNVMTDVSGGGSNAVTVNLAKTPPFSGSIGEIVVEGNCFHAASSNAGQAIAVALSASTLQGRLNIWANVTRNYNIDWYVRGTREVQVERNRALSTGSTTPYLDDGSNGTVLRRQNRLSDGRLYGTATLSGGSATIPTPEIRSGDVISVSRSASGGTLGHLSVGSISGGSSFVINSTNAADTSTVFWEIVH
jgi:hypothetical protein